MEYNLRCHQVVLFNKAVSRIEGRCGERTDILNDLIATIIGSSNESIEDIRIFFLLDGFLGFYLPVSSLSATSYR